MAIPKLNVRPGPVMPSRVGAERPPAAFGADVTPEKSTLSTPSNDVLIEVASPNRLARGPTHRSVVTSSAVVPSTPPTAGMNAYDGSACGSVSETSARVGSTISVGYNDGSMTNADSTIAEPPSAPAAV